MYIRKVKGPRAVQLPDGSHISRADLPPTTTTRWVASRKSAVVKAVAAGLITRQEACEMYQLSDEELASWCGAIARFGQNALKTTALQKYRRI